MVRLEGTSTVCPAQKQSTNHVLEWFLSVSSSLFCFLHVLCPPPEPEPEQTHLVAKVLRVVLCSGCGQEHPHCRHEQFASERRADAPQVRPEGLHVQAPRLG